MNTPSTKLIWVTPQAEELITMMARVSNPSNQDNMETAPKLLRYLINHRHWSPFEMASMCIEINTTRAISAQIIRHRSFAYQEFSQRYANANELGSAVIPHLRRQDTKNRQNSTNDLVDKLGKAKLAEFYRRTSAIYEEAEHLYKEMVSAGVAKECARSVLPLASPTRIYMCGTLRSWIHYIDLRTANGTQQEHKEIAEGCKKIFTANLPVIAEAAFKQ